MSKMDGLRAMREARYQEAAARAAKAATTKPASPAKVAPGPDPAPPARPVKQAGAKSPQATPAGDEQLCGHRNMGGRTCTREQGHAAKSHRYS